jgi:hypothetical protein
VAQSNVWYRLACVPDRAREGEDKKKIQELKAKEASDFLVINMELRLRRRKKEEAAWSLVAGAGRGGTRG